MTDAAAELPISASCRLLKVGLHGGGNKHPLPEVSIMTRGVQLRGVDGDDRRSDQDILFVAAMETFTQCSRSCHSPAEFEP